MISINRFLFLLRLNFKLLTPYFLVLLAISFSHNAIAKPLSEYCVSKLKPEQTRFESKDNESKVSILNSAYRQRPSRKASFSKNGEKFTIETNGFYLQLKREGEEKVIQEIINNLLKPDDRMKYIFITENNWLFIHSDYNNYMIELDNPEKTFKLENLIKIPFDNDKNCNRFERWFYGGCPVNLIYHSQTLDRAIIPDYYPKESNQEGTAVEIVAGKIKIINSLDEKFVIAADLPEFGGIILRASLNRALFYDGNKITELELDLPRKRFSGQYPIWKVRKIGDYGEGKENETNERIYITNLRFSSEKLNFVIEVKKEAKIYTKKIPFAANVDTQNLSQAFLSFPGEYRKWGTTKNSIIFEISGKYQTILKIPESYYIPYQLRTIPHIREMRKGKKVSLDEPAIVFDVVHRENESSTAYYVKKISSSATCDVMLDPDNPVELPVD